MSERLSSADQTIKEKEHLTVQQRCDTVTQRRNVFTK